MGLDKDMCETRPAWLKKNDPVQLVYEEIVAIAEKARTVDDPGFEDFGRKNLSTGEWIQVVEKLFAEIDWMKDALFMAYGDFNVKFGFGVPPNGAWWFKIDPNDIAEAIKKADDTAYARAPSGRD